VTEANASENNQRGFYTRWRQFMEASTWDELKSQKTFDGHGPSGSR
jgi:hypothetical protein